MTSQRTPPLPATRLLQLAVLTALAAPQATAQLQFEQRADRGLQDRLDLTGAVRLADFDGDGDLDVYVAKVNACTLSGSWCGTDQDLLYRNDGRGNFIDATAGHVPTDASNSLYVALADGDGDLDMVAANATHQRHHRRHHPMSYAVCAR